MVAEAGFVIEDADEWFDQKYLTINGLKTLEEFKMKGFAKYLLGQIFEYAKNTKQINIITLIVYKNNHASLNLYLGAGFETFAEYDDSYSLVKYLS